MKFQAPKMTSGKQILETSVYNHPTLSWVLPLLLFISLSLSDRQPGRWPERQSPYLPVRTTVTTLDKAGPCLVYTLMQTGWVFSSTHSMSRNLHHEDSKGASLLQSDSLKELCINISSSLHPIFSKNQNFHMIYQVVRSQASTCLTKQGHLTLTHLCNTSFTWFLRQHMLLVFF